MSLKTIFFCAQALLVQSIASQCIGYNGLPIDGMAYNAPYGAPCAGPLGAYGPWDPEYIPFAPRNGGSFTVSSTSPLAPNGVSVASENVIEGTLMVGGVLPFLGTVGMEAVLPTVGAGAVAYGCGTGEVGIVAEDYGYPAGPYGYPGPVGYAPGYPGYGPGFGPGYGPCGAMY